MNGTIPTWQAILYLLLGGGVVLIIINLLIKRGRYAEGTKETKGKGAASQAPMVIPDFGFDSVHYDDSTEIETTIESTQTAIQEIEHPALNQKKFVNLRKTRKQKACGRYRK